MASETTAPPVTIVEFLTARLDEDEARFEQEVEAETERYRHDGMPDATTQETRDYWLRVPVETEWPRYLAEIAAKRAIVARCGREVRQQELNRRRHDFDTSERHALRALASVYSDHPDYREEWASQ